MTRRDHGKYVWGIVFHGGINLRKQTKPSCQENSMTCSGLISGLTEGTHVWIVATSEPSAVYLIFCFTVVLTTPLCTTLLVTHPLLTPSTVCHATRDGNSMQVTHTTCARYGKFSKCGAKLEVYFYQGST